MTAVTIRPLLETDLAAADRIFRQAFGTFFWVFSIRLSSRAIPTGCARAGSAIPRPRSQRIVAGVNTARRAAYRAVLARGWRAQLIGIAMQRHDDPADNHAGALVLDDWR